MQYEVHLNVCDSFYASPRQFIDKSTNTIEIVNVTKIQKLFEEFVDKKKLDATNNSVVDPKDV